MSKNLMPDTWRTIDPLELRVLLDVHFGGPGQTRGGAEFYLPLADESCALSLKYKGAQIRSIHPGPAFNTDVWEVFRNDVEAALRSPADRISRGWGFSNPKRVTGSWIGQVSQVQILPPPSEAPTTPLIIADHPFILEVPIQHHAEQSVAAYRRFREHQRLIRLLNLLLRSTVSSESQRLPKAWVLRRGNHLGAPPMSDWTQVSYAGDLGTVLLDAPTVSSGPKAIIEEAATYYDDRTWFGDELVVPDDLDDMIMKYRGLPYSARRPFDRALYWLEMASSTWDTSASMSFAALVSAVEAMLPRGARHLATCVACNADISHDSPSITTLFQEFLEHHAPGASAASQRKKMYKLRSLVLHGSELLQLDLPMTMTWQPPQWNKTDLHRSLWALVRTTLRQWLIEQ